MQTKSQRAYNSGRSFASAGLRHTVWASRPGNAPQKRPESKTAGEIGADKQRRPKPINRPNAMVATALPGPSLAADEPAGSLPRIPAVSNYTSPSTAPAAPTTLAWLSSSAAVVAHTAMRDRWLLIQ